MNSSDSGVLKALFAEVGDTVTVGGNLFEVDSEGVANDTVTDSTNISAAATQTPSPSPAPTPVATQTQTTKTESYHRVPLIKFLGPRKFDKLQPAQSQAPQEAKPTQLGRYIFYESITMMPKKFQPLPFSDLEMDVVDVIFD